MTEKNDYNPVAFVEYVEKSVKRYIVRSKDDSNHGDLIKEEHCDTIKEQNGDNNSIIVQSDENINLEVEKE